MSDSTPLDDIRSGCDSNSDRCIAGEGDGDNESDILTVRGAQLWPQCSRRGPVFLL